MTKQFSVEDVKAVAGALHNEPSFYVTFCRYCGVRSKYGICNHTDNCPVCAAKRLLEECESE